jgi:putative membrane protein
MDDQKFLVSADKTLIRQRNLAQAAVQKSKNGNVFEFARRVVDDCSASLTELSRLMQAKHITEPSSVAEDLQLETSNRLQGLAGIDLDHKIISLMAAEQQQAVDIFSSAAETAGDPDVRKYASATLPALQRDSDRAAALEKMLSTATQK